MSRESLLIDPRQIAALMTHRTKAINIIHLNGRVCDLHAIQEICDERGLALIDDASHACGAQWAGKKLGNFSHITCFSLQGVNPVGKPVAGGEGGITCTNDHDRYQRMLAYCHLHRENLIAELQGSPFSSLDKEALGLKWRAHPVMAFASVSLESLEERNARLSSAYARTLECIEGFEFLRPPSLPRQARMGGFYGGLKLIYESSRIDDLPFSMFRHCLAAEGIPLLSERDGPHEYRRRLFTERFNLWGRDRGPIRGSWHGLDEYRPPAPRDFPVAEEMDGRVLTLPCFIDVADVYYTGLRDALAKIAQSHALLPRS